MILRFDTVIAWQRISQLTMETGEQRTYYLAPLPHRALLVLRNGVTLETARNAVVDVAVGMDRADPGFAHDPGIEQPSVYWYAAVHRAPIARRKAKKCRKTRAPNPLTNL